MASGEWKSCYLQGGEREMTLLAPRQSDLSSVLLYLDQFFHQVMEKERGERDAGFTTHKHKQTHAHLLKAIVK